MIDEIYKLKIELLTNGVLVSDEVKQFLEKEYGHKYYNDDYVTTTGLMLELDNEIYVTSNMNEKSNYKLQLQDDHLVLAIEDRIYNVKVWKPTHLMANKIGDQVGVSTEFVNVHFDRARLNPILGCNNHCAFCSMNEDKYKKNSIEELDAALIEALNDPTITHILISGGSPKSEDLEYLTKVYEYFCKKYSMDYNIDVMMTPRGFTSCDDDKQYEEYLRHLKKIGVKGLAINIELFNDQICAKYCKEKFKIGKEKYLKFLKLSGEIFGTENVRSGLIVGLEGIEDTLEAVEEICKCGVMPMLSPYIKYKDIGVTPSSELLIEVLERTQAILDKYNLPLAPLCKKCKHNTL